MKKKLPMVSIVVPVYRAEFFIADIIKNLSDIRYPNFEVVMVFDPSPDRGWEVARQNTATRKNFRITKNSKRLGISKSLNLGIKNSRGRYIIFFMTDMYVDPLCLSELVNYIESSDDRSLGAVVAKTYDFHKRNRIQAYRMYLMPQTGFLYIPEYGLEDRKKYDKPFMGFSGIDATLFKKEVFERVGVFDTDIDLSINDLDMIWRTWLAGFKIIRIPTARVYHWSLKEGRGTVKWEFTYAKMFSLFIQNYSLKYLLIYLPQLFIIYTGRSFVTLLSGNPDPFLGWMKALYWSIFYLPKALRKRKVVQGHIRVVSDEYLHEKIFSKLSFWEFYKHLRWTQKNITPIMITKEATDERILTYSK